MAETILHPFHHCLEFGYGLLKVIDKVVLGPHLKRHSVDPCLQGKVLGTSLLLEGLNLVEFRPVAFQRRHCLNKIHAVVDQDLVNGSLCLLPPHFQMFRLKDSVSITPDN